MKKPKLLIIFSLFMLSLGTLGFSVWIVGNNVVTSDVNVNFGNVVVNGKSMRVNKITTFQLCSGGIVKDETIVDSGEISINIGVDVKSAISFGHIDTNGNMNIETSFLCNNFDFIQLVKDPVINVVGSNCTTNQQLSSERVKVHDIVVPINKEISDLTFDLVYVVQGDLTPFFGNLPNLSFTMEALIK